MSVRTENSCMYNEDTAIHKTGWVVFESVLHSLRGMECSMIRKNEGTCSKAKGNEIPNTKIRNENIKLIAIGRKYQSPWGTMVKCWLPHFYWRQLFKILA